MGGEHRPEQSEGKGSNFSFSTSAAFGVQSERAATAAPFLENLRVLAVDDNATNRHILSELFASWGMDVVMADSAPAALTVLDLAAREGRPIALLVTDMMMPAVDGFELVERIKQQPALQGIQVIMLTSSNRPRGCRRDASASGSAHIWPSP